MYSGVQPLLPLPYRSCILSDFGNIWYNTVFRPNRSESEVLFTRATPYPPSQVGVKKANCDFFRGIFSHFSDEMYIMGPD